MTISYYAHAWQALLMFLAGVVSVLAAFAGYVSSGGAEELFRRTLANAGEIQYDQHYFKWRDGAIVFSGVKKGAFKKGSGVDSAEFSGIEADEVSLKFDPFARPKVITGITVRGMHNTAISVTEGFLQSGWFRQPNLPDMPTITFEDCDLKLNIGNLQPLNLTGCSGELRRTANGDMKGNFSLSELNGRPFRFKLESLEDGRWVFTGDQIQINTREAIAGQTKLFDDKLDPISFLVRALFTGEMGAEGMVSSLRIVVQPQTDRQKFTCDGEVGYKNLALKLPAPEQEAGTAVPFFIGQLVGVDGWPRWMQVDQVRTGERGRVAFHMGDGVLNFACDEGPASAFVGYRKGREFPPLENLKGSVETDNEGKPRRIILHGFLGNQLAFETRIDRNPDASRTYDLVLEPRSSDSQGVVFGRPLWRFVSHVRHYAADSKDAAQPLAEFEIEGDARHFPMPEWLPPGMQDVSGHMYAKGQFTRDNLLKLDDLTLDDGGSIVFGGADLGGRPPPDSHFAPLWTSMHALFGTESAWSLQDLSLQGKAEVQFSRDQKLESTNWESTKLTDWSINAGSIVYAERTTDIGVARLKMNATHKKQGDTSTLELIAGLPTVWQVKLAGTWSTPAGTPPTGTFSLIEQDVPLLLHPQRETLSTPYVSSDKRRVNRTQTVHVTGEGKPTREVKP